MWSGLSPSVLGGRNQSKVETHVIPHKTGMEGFEAVEYLFDIFQSKSVSKLLGLLPGSHKVWPVSNSGIVKSMT